MTIKKQIVAIAVNGMKIVIDKSSDPRNIELFSKISPTAVYNSGK